MRSAAPGDEAIAAWLEGLEFVRDRLLDVLSAEGVRPIETDGETFDPHLHVAVEATPASDEQPAGSIAQETRRGYRIGDAVLRYAEVVVAR
jgi:molecular chaperone GrpE